MMWVSLGLACYDHFQTTDNSTQNDWKPSRKVTLGDFKWAHIEMITVVFASVIEKDYRPQMTGNHQGKWLSCYLTHKNMELSATTPQNPRDCVALGKLWIYTLYPADTPKHNLLILWILSKCWFSRFWIWAPCNQFPNEKQSTPEPFSFSDKFSFNLRSISFKVFLMKMNQNSRPLPSPLYKFGKIYFVFLQDLWENPGIQQNGKSSG